MDDIRIWLYLVFGIIFFLIRLFKKKGQENTLNQPASQHQNRPQRKPVSFEELLREFTEAREAKNRPSAKEKPKEEDLEYQSIDKPEKEEGEYEGEKTRRFSDEESCKAYEESIAGAEGSKMTFERDDNFKFKHKRKEEQESEGAGIATEIKDMLGRLEDAKKAVVLGEILNRKY